MQNNSYNTFYSKKPVSELIEQLRTFRITGSAMHKDSYEALIAHLSERDLSFEEIRMVDQILSTDRETLKREKTNEQQSVKMKARSFNNVVNSNTESFKDNLSSVQTKVEDYNPTQISKNRNKYPALKTISAIFRAMAWIIWSISSIYVMLSLGALISLKSENNLSSLIGTLGFMSSLVIVTICGVLGLLLLACAELILVALDLEYNTRHIGRKM